MGRGKKQKTKKRRKTKKKRRKKNDYGREAEPRGIADRYVQNLGVS